MKNIYVIGSKKNNFYNFDKIRNKFLIDEYHENINIDYLNNRLCELTGLYYLWKNDNSNIVGLEHYRRYLTYKNKMIDSSIIDNMLIENSIIATYNEGYIKNNNIYSKNENLYVNKGIIYYFKCRKKLFASLEIFLFFLKKYNIDLYNIFNYNLHNKTKHLLCNMFITSRNILNKYCEFIFDIIFNFIKFEDKFNLKYEPRDIGYFIEFMNDAVMEYLNINVISKDIFYIKTA